MVKIVTENRFHVYSSVQYALMKQFTSSFQCSLDNFCPYRIFLAIASLHRLVRYRQKRFLISPISSLRRTSKLIRDCSALLLYIYYRSGLLYGVWLHFVRFRVVFTMGSSHGLKLRTREPPAKCCLCAKENMKRAVLRAIWHKVAMLYYARFGSWLPL